MDSHNRVTGLLFLPLSFSFSETFLLPTYTRGRPHPSPRFSPSRKKKERRRAQTTRSPLLAFYSFSSIRNKFKIGIMTRGDIRSFFFFFFFFAQHNAMCAGTAFQARRRKRKKESEKKKTTPFPFCEYVARENILTYLSKLTYIHYPAMQNKAPHFYYHLHV
ncbi:hypothetical protein F5X96DRAFT_658344, partial [Biscogniauxia mediterranea]